jgi:hypothetical protein
MTPWLQAFRTGIASGAAASTLSSAVLAARARQEAGSPYAGTNAVSHALWGDRAFRADAPSLKYTVAGYMIHHGASMLWATLYERRPAQRFTGARRRRRRGRARIRRRLHRHAAALSARLRAADLATFDGDGVRRARTRAGAARRAVGRTRRPTHGRTSPWGASQPHPAARHRRAGQRPWACAGACDVSSRRTSRSFALTRAALSGPIRIISFWPADRPSRSGSANR